MDVRWVGGTQVDTRHKLRVATLSAYPWSSTTHKAFDPRIRLFCFDNEAAGSIYCTVSTTPVLQSKYFGVV